MRHLVTLILFGAFVVGFRAAPDAKRAEPERLPPPVEVPTAIDGYYDVAGQIAGADNDGKYTGVALIQPAGRHYTIQWLVEGATPARGVGFRDGNGFIVSSGGGNSLTATRYDVSADREGHPLLTGRWVSLPGNGLVHEEKLTWLKGRTP